ncbi:MAG: mechanosensitive ion channel family protein [Thermodesulfovibrio sp.]|nr:mechanosensitive ion channel family protein [Thermodesulfovibrio sp.]
MSANALVSTVLPSVIAIIATGILLVVRAAAFRLLRRWGGRTANRLDDIIIPVIETPSVYWCIAIGLYLGIALSELPEKYVFYTSKTIHVIVILSITIAAANLAGKIFRDYIRRSSLPVPTTGLAYGIMYGSILVIGILVTLSVLGISIAPLITALGVGGLAVALALQDTLSNLFAGIHILVEKSVRVGDFIRLENGLEGYIEDITWRTTRIRMPANNMIVIPNNKLSQSIVTNYHLPEKRLMAQIQVSVSYEADPDLVEAILIDEAGKAAAELEAVLTEPAPVVHLSPGFGEASLEFTVAVQVREFSDQAPAQHELRKRVLKRFRKEGIRMPFPRSVFMREYRT